MFIDIKRYLSSLVEPLDFIDEKPTRDIVDEVALALVKEINTRTNLQVYLLDILYLFEESGEIYLKPLIAGNKYGGGRGHGGRPDAKTTLIRPNSKPKDSQDGIWSWAYSTNYDTNIWINDIQKKEFVNFESNDNPYFTSLEGGYLMVTGNLDNEDKSKKPLLPKNIIIFGETTSIIIIPLLHRTNGREVNVGLLSIESRKNNFTPIIFRELLSVSKLLSALLWRLNANSHVKEGTRKAVSEFSKKMRSIDIEKTLSSYVKVELPKDRFVATDNAVNELRKKKNDLKLVRDEKLSFLIKEWEEDIINNKLLTVLTKVNRFIGDSEKYKELYYSVSLNLIRQFTQLERQLMANILSQDEESRLLNKITDSLLKLINKL